MAGAVQDGRAGRGATLPRRKRKGAAFRPPLRIAYSLRYAGRAGGHEGPRIRAYLPISDFALSGVIAVVGTVTTVSTFSAQSSRIFLAISIASGPPVG
jgi:hypothetical protein